jgi:heme exporter protein C
MERLRKILLLVGVPIVTIHAALVPDAKNFMFPEFARIFFWHFPCPMMATLLICMGLYFSVRYMHDRDPKWDVRSTSCHELAMIFIALTMISGIFFSRIQWGHYWENDPRQTSFLLVTCIYFAYFVLRSAFQDPDKRANNSAAFAIAAFLPFMFLTFVYPRLPQILANSNHPSDTVMKGNLKGGYAYATIEILFLVSIITQWIYSLRSRAGILEREVNNYGHLQNTGSTASHTPVVRRISVSDEN